MKLLGFSKHRIDEAIYWENMLLVGRLGSRDFVRSLTRSQVGVINQLACVFLNRAFEKLGRDLSEVLTVSCESVRQTISRLNDPAFIKGLEPRYMARLQQASLGFLKLSSEYTDEVGWDTCQWVDAEYRG